MSTSVMNAPPDKPFQIPKKPKTSKERNASQGVALLTSKFSINLLVAVYLLALISLRRWLSAFVQ
jgi:hypothetical protein